MKSCKKPKINTVTKSKKTFCLLPQKKTGIKISTGFILLVGLKIKDTIKIKNPVITGIFVDIKLKIFFFVCLFIFIGL